MSGLGRVVGGLARRILTMDHVRLTPADARESGDLAIVADG
jgi:hypothetical protein